MTFMERLPPITRWARIKYLLWYKWQSKYRMWKTLRSIRKGTFFPKIKNWKPTIKIDDIVKDGQMTHIQETKLDWKWYKKVGPGNNFQEIDPPGEKSTELSLEKIGVDLKPMTSSEPLKAPTQETLDRLCKWHDDNPVDFAKMHRETKEK